MPSSTSTPCSWKDPELVEKPRDIIRERRCNAEWALVQQMEHLVEQFEAVRRPYLRERKFDVVQVVERVVKELLGHPGRAALKNTKKSGRPDSSSPTTCRRPTPSLSRTPLRLVHHRCRRRHVAHRHRRAQPGIPAVVGLENARGR